MFLKGGLEVRKGIGWPDVPTLAIATLLAIYGIYLVVIGPVINITTPSDGSTTSHDPTMAGLIPLVSGALVIYGIVAHRSALAWAGGFIALVFTVAFLFSLGGALIPIALLLLLSLALRNRRARPQAPAAR